MQNRIYFKNLDALRCLAAFMVVGVHVYEGWLGYSGYPSYFTLDQNYKPTGFSLFIDKFLRNGTLGVDIFFLISGFLICYLLIAEKKQNGTLDLKRFYIRRCLRIWPLYYLVIAISPLIISWMDKASPHYLSNLFFYNNFHSIQTGEWTFPFGHLWSICIEEHFYLICPMIVLIVNRKWLPGVFVGLVLISILYRSYAFLFENNWFKLYLHTFSRFDALIIGCLAAIWHFESPFKPTSTKFTRVVILVIFILMMLFDYHFNWESLFMSAFKKYLYLLTAGYLMVNFVFNPSPLFSPPKWINYLGKISFGIYMYSNILVPIIAEKWMKYFTSPGIAFFAFLSMNIILTVIIAAFSYEFFEKFFLKLKVKFEVIKPSESSAGQS